MKVIHKRNICYKKLAIYIYIYNPLGYGGIAS